MTKEKKASPSAVNDSNKSFQTFEKWCAANNQKLLFGFLILSFVLSFISFNARISEAHDDALYLEGGWRYVTEFPTYFYTQNAPLYPMFLGLLIKFIGFKLIIFKLFSMVFNVLGVYFFYKALSKKLPAIVFIPVVLFQASNYLVMYFASMTFTEAFYFFLQGLFFFYAVKVVDMLQNDPVELKSQWKTWLLLGLSMFLISTAKSAAIVAIPAVLLYFIIDKKPKAAVLAIGAYLVFKLPYEVLVKLIWSAQNQFAGQSKILLQKDPYDKGLGEEDFSGFIQRFIDNCNLSLSKRFYQLLGWRDEFSTETYGFITLVTLALLLFGLYKIYKDKNRAVLLVAIFTTAQLVLSFLILQARWDQPRITLVCMPVMLILILYGIYGLSSSSSFIPTIYGMLLVLMVGSVLLSTLKRGFKNIPVVKKNLTGDTYYGYTPDWQNFLKASEWCADSLPANTLVASRKAPMSFVYGKGKKFFPIYSVIKKDTTTNQSNPDSALTYLQKNNVTHVLLGSLRVNPTDPSVGIINTVHNIIGPIADKYPNKLKLVHVEGQFEETYIYQIIY
jgi:hypothetical protein